ncbi:MAG: M48 family metallopeptidase [Cyanobacteria bacterium P01_A01_bin.135]
MSADKIVLHGIRSDQFRHPFDLEATRALQQLPGFDLVIRNLLGSVAERFFYLDNISSSIAVSEAQLPHLHKLLTEACEILDLDVPQLYLRQNPQPNAYTFAMRGQQPFIVLHTSLVDMLSAEEIQAVIAHELGHLKCEHGVYLTLANIILLASGELPLGVLVAQSLQAQILQWVRCAEFTCDRAALLVAQDSRTVASVLMKLTGGSPLLASQLSLDAFLEQARSYDRVSADDLGKLLKEAQVSQLTHPLPVLRAREIERWSASQNYQALLSKGAIAYNGKTTLSGAPAGSASGGGWRNW